MATKETIRDIETVLKILSTMFHLPPSSTSIKYIFPYLNSPDNGCIEGIMSRVFILLFVFQPIPPFVIQIYIEQFYTFFFKFKSHLVTSSCPIEWL